MTYLKRLVLFFLCLGLLIAGFIGFKVYKSSQNQSQKYIERYSEGEAAEVTAIQKIQDDRFVLVGLENPDRDISYLQDYVVTGVAKQLKTEFYQTPVPISEEEYYHLFVYDIDNFSTEPRMISVLNLLEENSTFRPGYGGFGFQYQGKDYYYIRLVRFNEPGPKLWKSNLSSDEIEKQIAQWVPETKRLVIDLETGQPTDAIPIDFFYNDDGSFKTEVGDSTEFINQTIGGNLYGYLSAVLKDKYNLLLNPDGTIDINSETDISGTNFAQLFPEEAKNFSKMSYLYMRPESFSTAEWLDKLFYWFAPAGQEGLEVEVEGDTVYDKTPIHSYAEYQAWLELHPKDKAMNRSSEDGN